MERINRKGKLCKKKKKKSSMYPGSDVLIKTIHVYNSTSWNGVKSLSRETGCVCVRVLLREG